MLSSKKSSLGASTMALVAALVAAAVCVLLVMVASVGASRSAEAQPRYGGPDNPLRYVTQDSRSNNISPNTRVTATVFCPGNTRVISGGFDVHFPTTPWFIVESRPGRAWWSVSASLRPADVGRNIRPFTAYAVCAPERLVPSNASDIPSRTVPARSGSIELTPDCPRQSKAIGGGFDMGNMNRQLIRTQPNPGNGFRSWIVKVGTGGQPGDISAYSVCVREDVVRDLRFLQRAETSTGIVQVGTERCPQGTYLLGGGAGTTEDDASGIRWSHIRPGGGSQADPPKDWAASAQGGPIVRRTVHAHAMCGELVGPQARGGGGGGATNDNDAIKIGKNFVKVGGIKVGKNLVKVGGIKVGKNFVKAGGIRIANGEVVRVGSLRLR